MVCFMLCDFYHNNFFFLMSLFHKRASLSSVGEESCNAGDPGLIPGSGRSAGKGIPTPVFLGFHNGAAGKESTCNLGGLGSIPGLGRSPGEGKGYPLQYSVLENTMNCMVHGVAKS